MRAITDTRSFAQRVYQELGDAREKYGNTASEVALVEMAVAWALREEHEVPETRAAPDEAARRLPEVEAERDAAVAKAAEAAVLLAEAIRRAEKAERAAEERLAEMRGIPQLAMDLAARLARAEKVLMDVEWSGTTGEWSACPSCGAEWHKVSPAHRAGCALVTALGR